MTPVRLFITPYTKGVLSRALQKKGLLPRGEGVEEVYEPSRTSPWGVLETEKGQYYVCPLEMTGAKLWLLGPFASMQEAVKQGKEWGQ